LYYSSPPVSIEEIMNARIHAIYILDVESGKVEETEPSTYIEMVQPLLHVMKSMNSLSKIARSKERSHYEKHDISYPPYPMPKT
ncbi:hypothetical protein DRO64_10880, partial [Candidatus Bathyarchaeota archaeon]